MKDNLCGREGVLVAYLYGEANEAEAREFLSHTKTCASCRTELGSFGDVRQSIGAWREQALRPRAVTAFEATRETARQSVPHDAPRRSALAALREFFTLSPMWLRGATAVAALLLVALLVSAALRFFNRPAEPVVQRKPAAAPIQEKQPAVSPNEQKQTLAAVEEESEPQQAVQPQVVKTADAPKRALEMKKAKGSKPLVARRKKTRQAPSAPVLSDEARQQLTEVLIAGNETEDDVPRLSDLLGETN